VRKYLAFVGFDEKNSLLAPTNPVEFRLSSEINRGEIQIVIECRRAWDKSPRFAIAERVGTALVK
jgi:hypothetical protein